MSEKCYSCFRPKETCYCKYIKPVKTNIKFVFLMHPMEAYKQRTGTGRLAHLSLPNSEIIIGVDFTEDKRLNSLLNDTKYFPVVMFPDDDAWTATKIRNKKDIVTPEKKFNSVRDMPTTLKQAIGNRQLLVVLVDGTWACAKKMLKLSKNVMALQKVSFDAGYKTEYTFKKEPAEDYISTIETCYYLIKELQEVGICVVENNSDSVESLMHVFRKMVAVQLESQKNRENSGTPNRYTISGERRKQNLNCQSQLKRTSTSETSC